MKPHATAVGVGNKKLRDIEEAARQQLLAEEAARQKTIAAQGKKVPCMQQANEST